MNKRFVVLIGAGTFLLTVLCGRILYISVDKNSDYTRAVECQEKKTKIVAPARGQIYDRNGIPFTNREQTFLALTENGEISRPTDDGSMVFSCFQRYSKDSVASHLLGYISQDGNGLCGVEKLFNNHLISDTVVGVNYEGDAVGRPYPDSEVEIENSRQNLQRGIMLTIDYHIQSIVERIMYESIKNGAVVILDTKTFDIVAMASRPDYDSSNPAKSFSQAESPLLNRALCAYNAGSVFKIVTAAASLDGNMQYFDRLFYCHGYYEGDDNEKFVCNKPDGHRLQTYTEAFADSCNSAFYETGICTGGRKICDMAVSMGMGSPHAGMAEEATGLIPLKDEYTTGEIMNLSIGQGEIMITPLQCAVMCAIIANDGIRKDVNLLGGTVGDDGAVTQVSHSTSETRIVEKETARAIGAMMRDCVLNGTGAPANISEITIAAKTGSAETGWLLPDGTLAQHGWFCGFFPYESPRYAMAILSENGKSGAGSCVEPFVKICDEINKIYPLKQ